MFAPFSGFSLCSPSFVRSGISRLINSTFIFYVESFRDVEVEAGVRYLQGWKNKSGVFRNQFLRKTTIWHTADATANCCSKFAVKLCILDLSSVKMFNLCLATSHGGRNKFFISDETVSEQNVAGCLTLSVNPAACVYCQKLNLRTTVELSVVACFLCATP